MTEPVYQIWERRRRLVRKVQLSARIVAVVGAAITIGWIVVGILPLREELGMGLGLLFGLAAISLIVTFMAAHVGWLVAPRAIREFSDRLDGENPAVSDHPAGPEGRV